jgi:hypothetical protein
MKGSKKTMKSKGGSGAAKLQPSEAMTPTKGGYKGVSQKRDFGKGKSK